MASSFSSDNYDVFLNFRGEDTRVGFTCHLYDALHRQKKIKTFIDDEELRRGDEISPALLNAIQGSKISVVIFSKDYASSKWCLNELVKILECKNTNGQIVIPVFYSVSPSDVRHQTGIFGHGFDKLEQQFKEKPEMVQKWRDALTETSHLAGHESTKFRHDAELVNEIVEDVLKKLEKITVSTNSSDGLVGLSSRIEQIEPLLCMDLSDTVQILGIWGMGGIGKTTLATAIFNQFSSEFEGRCFVSDVRRNSETGDGLEHLQKLILSTILSEKLEVTGPNIPQFTKERVRRMKALVVLDDVNKVRQLDGLIGGRDQYGPGSRIVVTTRDKQVLKKFGVEKIYRVNELKFGEAFELFCKFAFKEKDCPEDFKRQSWRVVEYADGNPLALKVLGSSLKSKRHWGNVLNDLNRICDSDIHGIYDILKISYNELSRTVKSMFLDIACFFEGEDKDFVTRILDDSGSYGLEVLVDKSLITVSNNCLQMHDLLQEVGREIVRRESEEEPGKRSRLWDPKEIRRVLKHNKGTDAIEGIFLDLSKIKGINLDPGVFKNMSNLRMLKFYVPKFLGTSIEEQLVQLPDDFYLPKNLRYLHWYKYPLRTLPSNFKPKNIVELSLPFSKVEQMWEVKRKACKLKSIDLSHSEQHLITVPDESEIPNLERIYLSNCTNLVHVHLLIQNFKCLSRLNFEGCKSLRSFPSNLHFVCPVTINFSSCVNLIEFPRISGKITELDLSWSAIEEIPPSIECLTDLKALHLDNCQRLKIISTSFCKLKSLEYLFLYGCLNLERFPEILEKMKHLKCISLCGTAITELPSSFENLEGLACLLLNRCSKLDIFPDISGNLTSLRGILAVGSAISQLPSSVAGLNELESFRFSGCRGLVSWPLMLLSGLSSLELDDCGLTSIPQEIGCLSSLEVLNLSRNNFESLPASLKQLSRLHFLCLHGCRMLQSLPELPLCLQSLEARNCKLLQSLPEIRSYLEEVDASELEERSKHFREELPNREALWLSLDPEPFQIFFEFTNCFKLNEKANNKILADLRLRIQHMIIASLRPFDNREGCELGRLGIALPGSEIPEWFSNQNSGSGISIQLPSHSFCRNLIGFAFCAVLDFKGFPSCWRTPYHGWCDLNIEIKIRSETQNTGWRSQWNHIPRSIYSDHVILGFDPFVNDVFPDGNNHTTVSFWFGSVCCKDYDIDCYDVKRCGVCPVYANPHETKPNTFTLSFATEVWKLDNLAGASGTSVEEELESSPKRICRAGQINTPLLTAKHHLF